jgi:hypothetical protein
MREQLKQLEGQLVVLQGRVAKARITEDDRYYFCVSKPALRPWDANAPLLDCKVAAKADHVWVQTDSTCNWPRLYEKHFMVGTCGYYRRKNGSVDLTVTKTAAILNGQKLIWEIESILKSKRPEEERLTRAKDLITSLASFIYNQGEEIDGKQHFVYSQEMSVEDITERVIALGKECQQRERSLMLQRVGHLKPVTRKPGSMLFLNQATAPKHKTALETLLGEINV